ncbi:MAG: hemerythrin domain-containing protein [Candidatus Omnitrophica bacterium]|nr:hemerythrin domain-containing protein [Candidatus Omnitrophota bacterium]
MEAGKCRSGVCVCQSLKDDHKTILREADVFYEALNKLRYEGRAQRAANRRAVGKSLSVLKKHLLDHITVEEKKIFPLLVSFLPRLEAVMYLLYSEHEEFRENLRSLEKSIGGLPWALQSQGMYLVCLLRSHFQIETQGVYAAVHDELRPDEKRRLSKNVAAFG